MSAENQQTPGARDPGALHTSMREAAQRAQELQRQVEAARTSLTDAAAKVAELEQQSASAQRAIVEFEQQEQAIARALHDAHRTGEELLKSAKARAEETIAAAKSAAEGIVQSARATATGWCAAACQAPASWHAAHPGRTSGRGCPAGSRAPPPPVTSRSNRHWAWRRTGCPSDRRRRRGSCRR